ncbi:MAG: family 16 glycoside hydrolase, partial [Planctomycetota bacterium]
MRLNNPTNLCLAGAILVFTVLAWVFTVCFADWSQAEESDENSKCYVCHPALKTEELTTNHLDMGVTCDECHGPSTEHMHDEMLMTKPDLLFGRAEVNKMCSNPSCHKPGDQRSVYGRQDHGDPVAVEAFFKKWRGRMRPNGRAITTDSVCTDCHGKHNLDKPTGTQSDTEQPAEWVAAFNGRDLTGWRPSGAASWVVKGGQIIATPGANGKSGALWNEAEYKDYLLAVTFRATWPIHAGIWLRAADSQRSPRIEIFDSHKPEAFTGSVSVPGKGLVLVNLREDLIDPESWNTISVKVQGDRVAVWLNAEEIGAVRTGDAAKGKIGLYLDGSAGLQGGPKQGGSKSPPELCVRE